MRLILESKPHGMTTAHIHDRDAINPLDRIERVAERHRWNIDRSNDHEVVMLVGGGWANLNLSLTWREDLEALHSACTLDLKVPEKRRDEVAKLLASINSQLIHGHYDLWADGSIVFRYSLMLVGGAEANDEQCEGLIQVGVETTHTYYPAIQFVIWGGQTAEEALNNALLETMGEA